MVNFNLLWCRSGRTMSIEYFCETVVAIGYFNMKKTECLLHTDEPVFEEKLKVCFQPRNQELFGEVLIYSTK